MHTQIRKAVTRAILVLGLLMVVGYGGAAGQSQPATYVYTFTNHCPQTIFIGQNGPGPSSTPPVGGNWALGPACTSNGQCGTGQTRHPAPRRLNERGSELLLGGPFTLPAEGRNTATTARFKTPPGQTPVAGVTIGSRGRGQYTLLMDVSRTTIDVPGVCPQPELTTTIRVEDGTNPPLLIAIEQPWQCRTRWAKVEYLRTP